MLRVDCRAQQIEDTVGTMRVFANVGADPDLTQLIIFMLALLIFMIIILIGSIIVFYKFNAFNRERQHLEQMLRQSEAEQRKLALIARRTVNAVIFTNAHQQIEWVNEGFTRITEYTLTEALGRNLIELLQGPETDPATIAHMQSQMANGTGFRSELLNYSKFGRRFWLDIEVQPIYDRYGQLIQFMAIEQDITERKQATKRLEDLAQLFENGPATALRWSGSQIMTISAITANIKQYGYTAEDFLSGRVQFQSIIHPDDQARVQAEVEYNHTISPLPPFIEQEYRIVCADGTVRDIYDYTVPMYDERGQVTHADGYLIDVTERRAQERALHQSQTQLHTLATSIPDLIVRVDHSFRFTYVNPAMEIVTGRAASEIIGRTLFDLLGNIELIECMYSTLTKVFADGKARQFDFTYPRSKKQHFFETRLAAELNAEGQPEAIVAITRDITERVQANEQRRALEEHARQAQKIEALGRLASGIAHDFNNLLIVINGCSELLIENFDSDHPDRPLAESIITAGASAANLTRQLLLFSRQQQVTPQPIHLNLIVTNIEKILLRVLGSDITLSKHLTPDISMVYADASQIEQVLLNLVINARDAMPNGGHLYLETGNHEITTTQPITGLTEGSYVYLLVRDTGVGMAAEVQAHIFEPFYTTKELGNGTGLGLATTFGIIQQSGGWITVESSLGNGSTFRVYLPHIKPATDEPMYSYTPQPMQRSISPP
jgi:PAS domain S-box-containing protein